MSRRWGRDRAAKAKEWIPNRSYVTCPASCRDKQGKICWSWTDLNRATCFGCGTPHVAAPDWGNSQVSKGGGGRAGQGVNLGPAAAPATSPDLAKLLASISEGDIPQGQVGDLLRGLKALVQPPAPVASDLAKAHVASVQRFRNLTAQRDAKAAKLESTKKAVTELEAELIDLRSQATSAQATMDAAAAAHKATGGTGEVAGGAMEVEAPQLEAPALVPSQEAAPPVIAAIPALTEPVAVEPTLEHRATLAYQRIIDAGTAKAYGACKSTSAGARFNPLAAATPGSDGTESTVAGGPADDDEASREANVKMKNFKDAQAALDVASNALFAKADAIAEPGVAAEGQSCG